MNNQGNVKKFTVQKKFANLENVEINSFISKMLCHFL